MKHFLAFSTTSFGLKMGWKNLNSKGISEGNYMEVMKN